MEWNRKVTLYLNKHVYSKKQNVEQTLKRRVLTVIKKSVYSSSQVYDYIVHKSKLIELPSEGRVCINCTGLYFFSTDAVKHPELIINYGNLLEFSQKSSKLKLKFFIKKEIRTVFITSLYSKQFCEDIASCLIMALRENKVNFYSYYYLARMIPPGISPKEKLFLEEIHAPKFVKCNETLNSVGETIANFSDPPYSLSFYRALPPKDPLSRTFYFDLGSADIRKELQNRLNKKSIKGGYKPQQTLKKRETQQQPASQDKRFNGLPTGLRFKGKNLPAPGALGE